MPSVAKGYNRDVVKLSQINLGLLIGQETGIPVFCENYNGSIPDTVKLRDVLYRSLDYGIKNVTFVLDRGFDSKSNKELFTLENFKFLEL